ncbi:MAG TPA: ABC transporter ATP-binding protein [Candidatus Galloscillospira excrementavium]|nr:ABC transporter ATP-binding protein [Candidatus Galloscillospira excrementavium]
MSEVMVKNLVKDFGKDTHVLKGLDLTIRDGSFTVLLGPSGCGKSTLLRIVAGLESPTSGQVLINGQDVTRAEPCDRDLAMVFQNYALYPHMTVFQNVEYGLKLRKMPKGERTAVVEQALELVDLADQAKKRPAEMSGGQRQRVALARAIVKRPGVYLMDEPLSNLDAKLRGQMREKITELYHQLGATFLYVTHDQVEAMSMGTHIVLLQEGNIAQQGTPQEIYQEPCSTYVAGFLGAPPSNLIAAEDGFWGIRPEHIRLTRPEEPVLAVPATARIREQLGDSTIHSYSTRLGELRVKTPCLWDEEGSSNVLYLPERHLMRFDASGRRIPALREQLDRLESLV